MTDKETRGPFTQQEMGNDGFVSMFTENVCIGMMRIYFKCEAEPFVSARGNQGVMCLR